MKKTSIYLAPELDERLAQRAAEEGLTKAEFIRRGLASLVTKPKRRMPHVGVFDGPPDLSKNFEEKYLEGFGER